MFLRQWTAVGSTSLRTGKYTLSGDYLSQSRFTEVVLSVSCLQQYKERMRGEEIEAANVNNS